MPTSTPLIKVNRTKALGAEVVLHGNVYDEAYEKALELAHKYDFIYAAVGVHPSEVEEMDGTSIEELRELSRDDKCVAIGEIGLDYHWPDPAPELQKEWLSGNSDLPGRKSYR